MADYRMGDTENMRRNKGEEEDWAREREREHVRDKLKYGRKVREHGERTRVRRMRK